MNFSSIRHICSPLVKQSLSLISTGLLAAALLAMTLSVVQAADPNSPSSSQSSSHHNNIVFSSKKGVIRQYSTEDRVRYQLWDYKWKPDPTQPITRIEVRLTEQKVYIYQNDEVAGESPITTGKPGHDTPPGHYSVLVKDIDHKSNLYGVFLDSNGYIIDGNAAAGQKPPPGAVYDSADMPYYLRIRDDGVGLHAGYLPGYPASHGCIRMPHAFAELLFSNVSVGTPVDVVP